MNTCDHTAQVAIVLVNWNAWRDTVECISSIIGGNASSISDIWVVDNDSSDGSVEHIAAWCAKPELPSDINVPSGVRHMAGNPIACQVCQANGQPVPKAQDVKVTIVRSGANLGFAGGIMSACSLQDWSAINISGY